MDSAENNSLVMGMENDAAELTDYKDDMFCWTVEGVCILIIGLIGLFGNSCSMVLFSRQKVHRIFHHLLLLLTCFDLMYVVCSVLLFSLSKFIAEYDVVYRIYLLPYLLPIAHVGLMGSVYCTLALTIERFLAVCYPFLKHRRAFTSKAFVLPVVIFTLLYNLPKFFELYVKEDIVMKSVNCSDIEPLPIYDEYIGNCTNNQVGNVTVPDLDENSNLRYKISIAATSLRTNRIYIRVYILWLNLIVQILVPFVLLVVLNIRTYDKVLEFEQTLNNMQVRVCFNSRKSRNQSTIVRIRNGSGAASNFKASENNLEMAQLMPANNAPDPQAASPENPNLLTRLESVRKCSNNLLSVEHANNSHRSSVVQANSENAIVSGHGVSDLRRREVVLAKISIYMVFVFLICHSVKIVPNIYEMVQTYLVDYHPDTIPWPTWISRMTNISHFLLTFACSANFYIYFAKHSQRLQRLFNFRKWFNTTPPSEEEQFQGNHSTMTVAPATGRSRTPSLRQDANKRTGV